MGNWGTGAFENDNALNFTGSLRALPEEQRLQAVEDALRAFAENPPIDSLADQVRTDHAYAAAAVLAEQRAGHPSPWVYLLPSLPSELDALAIHVLDVLSVRYASSAAATQYQSSIAELREHITHPPDTGRVDIHEDNSGAVYLTRNGQTWNMGPVTPDMQAKATVLAIEWFIEAWLPNDADGQTKATLDGLDHIATWSPTGFTIVKRDGVPVAGAGGRRFLGLDVHSQPAMSIDELIDALTAMKQASPLGGDTVLTWSEAGRPPLHITGAALDMDRDGALVEITGAGCDHSAPSADVLAAIQAIVTYNWATEQRDYDDQDDEGRQAHIFLDLRRVQTYLDTTDTGENA